MKDNLICSESLAKLLVKQEDKTVLPLDRNFLCVVMMLNSRTAFLFVQISLCALRENVQ